MQTVNVNELRDYFFRFSLWKVGGFKGSHQTPLDGQLFEGVATKTRRKVAFFVGFLVLLGKGTAVA